MPPRAELDQGRLEFTLCLLLTHPAAARVEELSGSALSFSFLEMSFQIHYGTELSGLQRPSN